MGEQRISGSRQVTDTSGVGADTGPDNVEELTDRVGPAVLGQQEPQPGRPGSEIGKSLPRDDVPSVQRHPAERGERQIPGPAHRAGHVPVDEPGQASGPPHGVVRSCVVVADDQARAPLAAHPPDRPVRRDET